MTDVLRVSRLHTFLSRAVTLMRNREGTAAVQSAAQDSGGMSTSAEKLAKVGLSDGINGLLKTEGPVVPSGPLANGALKRDPDEATPAGQAEDLPELVWKVPGSGAVQLLAVGPVRAMLLVKPLLPQETDGTPGDRDAKPAMDSKPSLRGLESRPSALGPPGTNGIQWDSIPRLPTMDFSKMDFSDILGSLNSGLGPALASFGPNIDNCDLLGPRLSISNFLVFDSPPTRSPERAAEQPAAAAADPPPPHPQATDVPSLCVCVEWVAAAQAPAVSAPAARVGGAAEAAQRAARYAQRVREALREGPTGLGLEELEDRLNSAETGLELKRGGGGSGGLRVSCRVRSVPPLPSGVLSALAALAGALTSKGLSGNEAPRDLT